jgi:hypothetical protein
VRRGYHIEYQRHQQHRRGASFEPLATVSTSSISSMYLFQPSVEHAERRCPLMAHISKQSKNNSFPWRMHFREARELLPQSPPWTADQARTSRRAEATVILHTHWTPRTMQREHCLQDWAKTTRLHFRQSLGIGQLAARR